MKELISTLQLPFKARPRTSIALICLLSLFATYSCHGYARIHKVESNQPRVKIGKDKNADVALWIARSCVGEAGFNSARTGECAAIAHIYRKRLKASPLTLYQVVRRYSAAVKPGPHNARKWVYELRRDLRKPKHWRESLSWSNHKVLWSEVLQLCDDFLAGKVADPLPHADHYGGTMDHWRARKYRWYKLDTPNFKNGFWSVIDPSKKAKNNG